MTRFKTTALALFAALTVGAGISSASAETRFQDNHPRRAEVLARAHNEDRRITDARRDGDLNARQAHRLRVADRHVVRQEQRMAARHGGYITRHEQLGLNHEENRISRHIPD